MYFGYAAGKRGGEGKKVRTAFCLLYMGDCRTGVRVMRRIAQPQMVFVAKEACGEGRGAVERGKDDGVAEARLLTSSSHLLCSHSYLHYTVQYFAT